MKNQKKMGLSLLVALGIGSMIGGGIFNSPTDLIGKANPQTTLIAWSIGGVGIIALALVFQMLANKRPNLTGGIYSYARDGFGDFMGFNSAWGYWLSAFLGNVAFYVLMFKTVNSLLGEGNELRPIISFLAASTILWTTHLFITKGVKEAGILNAFITIGKLLPLVLVIIFGILVFKPSIFAVANWDSILLSKGEPVNIFSQVKGAMGTILWCFVGVEAATVLSDRAESQKIVGKATVLSILITLTIYVLISVIAMGVIPAAGLAESSTPLADVLNKTALGAAGGVIVKLGLIASLFGAALSWVILAAEIPYVAAKDGVMPKWFAKENGEKVPVNSLLITNLCTQIFLLALLSDKLQSAYYSVYSIATTTILVPYFLSALYSIKICRAEKSGNKDMIISVIAAVYAIYVIYAVGMKYLGLAFIMYTLGLVPYLFAKKERKEGFVRHETISSLVMISIAIIMVIQIAAGKVTP